MSFLAHGLKEKDQEQHLAKPCSRSSMMTARTSDSVIFHERPWKRKHCSFFLCVFQKGEGHDTNCCFTVTSSNSLRKSENASTCLVGSGTLGLADQGAAPPLPSSQDQSHQPLPPCHSVPFPVSASSLPMRQSQGSESNAENFKQTSCL